MSARLLEVGELRAPRTGVYHQPACPDAADGCTAPIYAAFQDPIDAVIETIADDVHLQLLHGAKIEELIEPLVDFDRIEQRVQLSPRGPH